MLVLARKTGESLLIDELAEVRVLEIRGGRVRLGITAPLDVAIRRIESFGLPGPENVRRIEQPAQLLETK